MVLYGLTIDEYRMAKSPEVVYAHEVDGDPIFERIVASLYEQAEEYLKNATCVH